MMVWMGQIGADILRSTETNDTNVTTKRHACLVQMFVDQDSGKTHNNET